MPHVLKIGTEQPNQSDRISARDESKLALYFGSRGGSGSGAMAAGSGTTSLGVLLELQELFAFDSDPCPRCNGDTFTAEDLARSTKALKKYEHLREPIPVSRYEHSGGRKEWARVTEENQRAYQAAVERHEPRCTACFDVERGISTGVLAGERIPRTNRSARPHCPDCRGSGKRYSRPRCHRKGQIGPCQRWCRQPVFRAVCETCEGSGVTASYDALPAPRGQSDPSYVTDQDALDTCAQVSRRLAPTRAKAPRAILIFADYFGDTGARWAATELGRIVAVYPHTKTGRRTLAKLQNPMGLGPAEQLATLAATARQQGPQSPWWATAEAMRREAAQELRVAAVAWNATAPPPKATAEIRDADEPPDSEPGQAA